MAKDQLNDLAREARREQWLGPDAVCLVCGESDHSVLLKVSKRWLEKHHVAGRIHDGFLIVVLCRNCHAKIGEGQLSEGMDLRGQEGQTLLHKLRAVLLGLALLCSMLAESLKHYAEQLERLILGLDRAYPAWREMPEVRS